MLNGERIYSIYSDGTWYTPIDLDMEDGGKRLIPPSLSPINLDKTFSDSIDVFKQQDGGAAV